MTLSPATFALTLLACVAVSWHNAVAQAAPAPAERTMVSDWTVVFGMEQGWDSNVRFVEPGDPGDFHQGIDARIEHAWQTPRTRVTLSATGGATRFQQLTDQNRWSYGGGAAVSRQLTKRLTSDLRYAYQSAVTRSLSEDVDGGLQLPLVLARSNDATGSATYAVSRRTALAVTGRYTAISFPSGFLVGGHGLGGEVTLTRQVSPTSALSLGYGYQHSVTTGQDADTHTAFGGWNQQLGRVLTMRLTAGVTRLQSLRDGERVPLRLVGSAAMQFRVGRNVLDANFERSVSQGFGLGRVLSSERVTAQYARPLTTDVALTLRGDVTRSRDPSDPAFKLEAGDCALGLRFPIAWGVTASVGGFARGRNDQVRVVSSGALFSLGYGGLP